jgi:hypothetical protein
MKSIDETMVDLFGRGVADALYSYLERAHSVSKIEIPNRLEVLLPTLEGVFGESSANTISRTVATNFYKRLGLPLPEVRDARGRTLVQYVEEAELKLPNRAD